MLSSRAAANEHHENDSASQRDRKHHAGHHHQTSSETWLDRSVTCHTGPLTGDSNQYRPSAPTSQPFDYRPPESISKYSGTFHFTVPRVDKSAE